MFIIYFKSSVTLATNVRGLAQVGIRISLAWPPSPQRITYLKLNNNAEKKWSDHDRCWEMQRAEVILSDPLAPNPML